MELENAMAPMGLLDALQTEIFGLPRVGSTGNKWYCRQSLGSHTGLQLCKGFGKALRHGMFPIHMYATYHIGHAEGYHCRASHSYGGGDGIRNRIHCLGRYTMFSWVQPFSWPLSLDDTLQEQQLSAENILMHRYLVYRRHNSTEFTPVHNGLISNYTAGCGIRSQDWFGDPLLLHYGSAIYHSINRHEKSILSETKPSEISSGWSI